MTFNLSAHQKEVLTNGMLKKLPQELQEEFFITCENSGLDPFRKQIYVDSYEVKKNGVPTGEIKATTIVGIDGLRAIAVRSGQYRGQTPAQWCGSNGEWTDVWLASEAPAAARVGILREGFRDPLYAVALWKECAANTAIWRDRGPTMLAKCAEAMGYRKAFPNETSGLYIQDEMGSVSDPNDRPQEPEVTGQSPGDRIKSLLKTSGHDIKKASEIEPPKSDIATFSDEEIETWLMPLIDEAGSTLDALRKAMRRVRALDDDIVNSDPTLWHVDWKERIQNWGNKIIEANKAEADSKGKEESGE